MLRQTVQFHLEPDHPDIEPVNGGNIQCEFPHKRHEPTCTYRIRLDLCESHHSLSQVRLGKFLLTPTRQKIIDDLKPVRHDTPRRYDPTLSVEQRKGGCNSHDSMSQDDRNLSPSGRGRHCKRRMASPLHHSIDIVPNEVR